MILEPTMSRNTKIVSWSIALALLIAGVALALVH